jgi:hypothetical protein
MKNQNGVGEPQYTNFQPPNGFWYTRKRYLKYKVEPSDYAYSQVSARKPLINNEKRKGPTQNKIAQTSTHVIPKRDTCKSLPFLQTKFNHQKNRPARKFSENLALPFYNP